MDSFYYLCLSVFVVFCAYRAMITQRILTATIYLACISALTTVILYLLGAFQVAVMELSVGAGLVTVLLVYALSVVGEDAFDPRSVVPKPLGIVLVLAVAGFLGWMILPMVGTGSTQPVETLANVLWQKRVLDVWVQIALIFSGVMGVLGLLSEKDASQTIPHPASSIPEKESRR